ncbi:hypothetical protein BKA93DRAFT_768900 [Sparassis latifolia]
MRCFWTILCQFTFHLGSVENWTADVQAHVGIRGYTLSPAISNRYRAGSVHSPGESEAPSSRTSPQWFFLQHALS